MCYENFWMNDGKLEMKLEIEGLTLLMTTNEKLFLHTESDHLLLTDAARFPPRFFRDNISI